jgi:cytochrome c-type biogenesis protein CcmH
VILTEFFIVAVLLTLVALLFVFWPLLGRHLSSEVSRRQENVIAYRNRLRELQLERDSGQIDADTYEALEKELSVHLLADAEAADDEETQLRASVPGQGMRYALVALGVVMIPVIAVLGYQNYGAMDDVRLEEQARILAQPHPDPAVLGDLQETLLVRALREPDNAQYWYLLGHTQMHLEDYGAASESFAQLRQLTGNAPNVLISLAQARFMASGGRVDEETRRVMERVLEGQPHQSVVLEMLAIDAFGRQDYEAAAGYLQRALVVPLPPRRAEVFREGLAEARRLAGIRPDGAELGGPLVEPRMDRDGLAAGIQVALDIGDGVEVGPRARIFVIARDPEGPEVPIAVHALSPTDLPAEFVLDDRQAMQATRLLSQFDQVELIARLTQHGQPSMQPGDLEVSAGEISTRNGKATLKLVQ